MQQRLEGFHSTSSTLKNADITNLNWFRYKTSKHPGFYHSSWPFSPCDFVSSRTNNRNSGDSTIHQRRQKANDTNKSNYMYLTHHDFKRLTNGTNINSHPVFSFVTPSPIPQGAYSSVISWSVVEHQDREADHLNIINAQLHRILPERPRYPFMSGMKWPAAISIVLEWDSGGNILKTIREEVGSCLY